MDKLMVNVFWRYPVTKLLLIMVCALMPICFGQSAENNGPASSQMSVEQFDQWLRNSGYGQSATTTTTTTTTALPRVVTNNNLPPANIPPPPKKSAAPITYEEGQQIMLESLPVSAPKPSTESAAAFAEMLQQNMPLAPEQVLKLRQQIDMAQRAAATPANIPPKPVSSTIMVNLAPGSTPPAIRLAQGYVTALVFVDSTGQPWPIAAFDVGNPKAVSIQWDNKSNIIMIQAVQPYTSGDIVIRLVGLPTPVTLELVSGQRVVDYRVDLHIAGIGPNTTELPVGTTLPQSASQLLLEILNGVAPPGSKLLTLIGGDCQAWLLGERIYLRTRMTLLSPGWVSHMSSPDGMQAYEIPRTSSILVSRFGEPAEVRIEGL